jgi:type IV pilus assembly protein PilB
VTIAAARNTELARAQGLAERANLLWIDLDAERIDPAAVATVPLELAESALAVPFGFDGPLLRIAIADPATRAELLDQIDMPHEFVVAPRASIINVLGSLRQTRRSAGSLIAVQSWFGDGAVDVEMASIGRAAESGSSDLHFVACEAGLAIRARIDGALRDIGNIPPSGAAAAISRLKVQARLDISDNRRSQEGRLTMTSASGREFDVRITTIPTVAGEGAALRILERTRTAPTLTEIGLAPELQLALERLVHRRRGALLVTGPTGSGKSTTIHAALTDIARPELNVITVEDPVEYRLDGIYQIEVNPHADVTFESGLRSILRSDPDVIAVGEMRDLQTAAMTLKAALTGSFVLSTLHTTDAPAALTRLEDMGVEPYVTAATVSAVLAQRLVRRLCVHCRERYEVSPDEARELGIDDADRSFLFRARGCDHCDRGYRGQIGIHQLMLVDDEIRQLALARAPYETVKAAATAAGMGSLWKDGLAKALAGLTSVEELRAALPAEA